MVLKRQYNSCEHWQTEKEETVCVTVHIQYEQVWGYNEQQFKTIYIWITIVLVPCPPSLTSLQHI